MPAASPAAGPSAMAARFRRQAAWAAADGERLYSLLLERAAQDVEREGVVWRVVEPYAGEPGTAVVATRFLAAVHRLVLSGRAPELAAFYPSAGGNRDPEEAWPVFRRTVERHEAACRADTARPCQTNEVGRCAPLLCGFLAVRRATGLPLRLLELGASAGLNLRWDRFDYGWWGDPASPVRLGTLFEAAPPGPRPRVAVSERAGCDREPIDPTTEDGALTLSALVWPWQTERMAVLRAAIEVARAVPATVDRADAADWLAERLARPRPGQATVVFHSVFLQYVAAPGRAALAALIRRAGAAASLDAPLAWLRMEPTPNTYETRLTLWPGGREALVATSGPHGRATRAW